MRSRKLLLLLLLALLGLGMTAGCRAGKESTGEQPAAPAAATEAASAATAEMSAPPPAAESLPSATPLPPTPVPSETPTATPSASLRQLSQNGCCVAPFWSPDGQQVLFIDRPAPDGPFGIWALGLQGGAAQFITGRVGLYSPDMQLIAYPSKGHTFVERLSDGQRWLIPSDGRAVSFSPDSRQVAWTISTSGPFDQAQRTIWISQFDGSQPQRVGAFTGGGFSAWLPDGRMLLNERLGVPGQAEGQMGMALWVFDPRQAAGAVQAGARLEIATDGRLRGQSLSPDGRWLAYLVTFAGDPAQNGIWLADLQDPASGARRLEVFGAYQWRDGGRLLVIPQEPGAPAQRVLQIEAASGDIKPLTDPSSLPFKIANGDWKVSPDGSHIVFVSAIDHNLWLITLPKG